MWQQYSSEQKSDWVNQALAIQEVDDSYSGESWPDNVMALNHSDIWYGDEVVPGNSGP
jgi:hypothetical protein